MAYQNVGTPRFYIDYFSYWQSIGLIESIVNYSGTINGTPLGLDPVTPFTISGEPDTNGDFIFAVDLKDNIDPRALESINYIGYLGHTFGDATAAAIRMDFSKKLTGAIGEWGSNSPRGACTQINVSKDAEIINAEHIHLGAGLDNYTSFDNSGFSLYKVNANQNHDGEVDRFNMVFKQYNDSGVIPQTDYADINALWNLNCFTMGHFYDMPVSPDLDVKMEIEFDGYDSTETLGGSTLTNVRYEGAPKWGNNNAWEIGESNPYYKRRGRRSWDLKFSYISDKDIFASNYSSSNWLSNTTDNSDYNSNNDLTSDENNFEYTLADDDSFIAKVLNFVGNGQRFIFQSDNTNNNPDQFAICVLDQDSLSISQKAFKSYEISLKIREVW
jgi:hypothetical protein|tara:strand:+ start:7585 stop:8742 length:1158 start_codon:yes stop_codon:yes gene_type:complete